MMPEGRVAASFVARIWLESRPNAQPRWRGHIRHVQSGEEGYFQRLQEMQAFLERVCRAHGLECRPPRKTSGCARLCEEERAPQAPGRDNLRPPLGSASTNRKGNH